MSSAGPLRAALERQAAESPEDPFLFFRGARGHFRWWSFARAAAGLDGAPATGAGEAEAAAFLATADERAAPGLAAALAGALGAPSSGRDIWLSYRPVAEAAEAALALWAADAGAAVLREASDPLHPELFAWARPTLVAAPPGELEQLLSGFAALAPRFGAARWRRRRLARLRAVLVEGGDGAPLRDRLAALGAAASVRVLPFPGHGW